MLFNAPALIFAGVALTSLVAASPVNLATRDLKNYVTDITIHESCNSTQRRMLEQAFADTFEVATSAHEYIRTNGPTDPVFEKYYGTKPAAFSAALGVWDALLYSNKDGVIFRCDNPDGNCGQPGWRGHWRGDNATSETVICDLSYTDRLYNQAFCMYGNTVAGSPLGTYWSIDLIHRLFHVPQVTNGQVDHYAEDYASVLELAEHNSTYSPFDSDAHQAFAAHVYAVEVAKGGDACVGQAAEAHDHDHTAATSSAAPAAATTAAAATSAAAAAPAATSAAASQDCHTHSDGTVHCV
ncbi:hypothetical protein CI109_105180 [Kwoniella shandongensis]|uniref:Putative peptidase domain-containing protein n=1 Tax=Kwoniella shandongensis TaxID=1734106 RepID=A0A5M6C395_9TREE|nr:uncharacterized protein CI109_002021 [Kwoniella shandongensis]KAA5529596.1 hypothetical protein CI109_002021 [Kwoniella shandongensis]